MDDKSVQTRVAELEVFRGKYHFKFPSFITHIRFPHFKNLTPKTRIDFTFPVTALVGANGSGKTSVLQALYGAPHRFSTGDFWFSTEVDPILEGDGSPNRYIYGHYHSQAKKIVETRKARVRKVIDNVENPNYWEPTKIVDGDEMDPLPILKPDMKYEGMSTDRWNPVKRKVIYINFRKELSAFDKYFYFGNDPKLKRLRKKQDLIRRDAKILLKIINSSNTSVTHYAKKITLENRKLNTREINWISHILGRKYNSATFIRHNLFEGQNGLSVQFTTNFGKYSEAFAGSGEVAITSVVVQVLKAPKGAIVLLDEPEVSLHPGAQERLLSFLLAMTIELKIQIVFSTHSPNMIAGLPDDALKVFIQEASGTFSILSESHPYAAFRRLGVRHGGEIRIIVEDRLAKSIVEQALLMIEEVDSSRFIVDYHPGGASAILGHRIPITMTDGQDVFFLLDGDQKKVNKFIDPDNIPTTKNDTLEAIIFDTVGVTPQFLVDGNSQGGNAEQRITLQRQYLKYINSNLMYLPTSCPEEIVLNSMPDKLPESGISSSQEAKKILKELVVTLFGEKATSLQIDDFGAFKIAEQKYNSADMKTLSENLKEIAKKIQPHP